MHTQDELKPRLLATPEFADALTEQRTHAEMILSAMRQARLAQKRPKHKDAHMQERHLH